MFAASAVARQAAITRRDGIELTPARIG